MDILISIVISVFVAIVTAYFTVRFSLKQFYSQKWWELTEATYSQLIAHLSSAKYTCWELARDNDAEFHADSEYIVRLNKQFMKAIESLAICIEKGSIIISDATYKKLYALWNGINGALPYEWDESLLRFHANITDCLETVRKEARKALSK